MRLDATPPATRAVLERASETRELAGSLLIGGTALALQAAHRLSEDLDFVRFEPKLDRTAIKGIVENLARRRAPRIVTSIVARQSMENEGLDVDDHHQDWDVDGVKVTFFAPDEADEPAAMDRHRRHALGSVEILDGTGVFELKSMLLLKRRTSRDLFDIWYLIEQGGRTVDDVLAAMGAHVITASTPSSTSSRRSPSARTIRASGRCCRARRSTRLIWSRASEIWSSPTGRRWRLASRR